MIATRIGQLAIGVVIAVAAVAIFMVLRPDSAEHNPPIDLQQVIDYAKFGQVEEIDVRGRTLIVRFVDDMDTESAFGVDARVFETTVPDGTSIVALLESEGVAVGGESGLRVTTR